MRLCCMLLDYYIHLNGLSHTDLAHHELESDFICHYPYYHYYYC